MALRGVTIRHGRSKPAKAICTKLILCSRRSPVPTDIYTRKSSVARKSPSPHYSWMDYMCLIYINRGTKVDPSTGCWNWTRYLDKDGYGKASWRFYKTHRAHRVAYFSLVGDIPSGLQIDHLCRNRRCCNPHHLELVTLADNVRRGLAGKAAGLRMAMKTHCPKGHEYAGDNLHISRYRGGTHRECRACDRERSRRRATA
jgi:hypothetical protein